MDKRIFYSQNFLINKALISELIEKSSITGSNVVYEIGAGEGIITEELLKKAKKVIAFELDKQLFQHLKTKFAAEVFLELHNEDFTKITLPEFSYKVFSNIPFNLTSEIIHKLTEALNPPEDIYLIVQKEAAFKFLDKTLVSLLLKPNFDLSIIYEFKRKDFQPTPRVNCVMLRIRKREIPLVAETNKSHYRDFIVYSFSHWRKKISPISLSFDQWLEIFNKRDLRKNLFVGSYKNLLTQQKKLEKIHRTRIDKNWREFTKDRSYQLRLRRGFQDDERGHSGAKR